MESKTDQLTVDDIGVLIEALKLWETDNVKSAMSNSMMSVMLGSITNTPKEKIEEKMDKDYIESKTKDELRQENSILLKAKLIILKQNLSIERLRQ